jgi:PKD repeat protein
MPGCTAPVSGFTYSSFATGPVYFNEAVSSTGATSYSWDFGDGIGTSSLQNPTYLFNAMGTYQVCLTVSDICGTDVYCEAIEICPKPTAYFDYTINQLTVTFSDSSNTSSSATYYWEIATDSNMTNSVTSNLQNPTILMDSAGTYWVCLMVTDSCGSDWFCDSIVVAKMGTVGFEERSMDSDENLASIYPNPAKYKLSIRFKDLQENAEIQIVDVIGKLVMSYEANQVNRTNLDVSRLKNGVYFVYIKSSDVTMTKKIIINH